MKIHRHYGGTRDKASEVSECGFNMVFGKHRNPDIRAKISGLQPVGAAVQFVIHFGPAEGMLRVLYGRLIRVFFGIFLRESHGTTPRVSSN